MDKMEVRPHPLLKIKLFIGNRITEHPSVSDVGNFPSFHVTFLQVSQIIKEGLDPAEAV